MLCVQFDVCKFFINIPCFIIKYAGHTADCNCAENTERSKYIIRLTICNWVD